MKLIGAHVSAGGGVDRAPLNARKVGARAFALFVKNQKQWAARPYAAGVAEAFAANLREGGFEPHQILPHAGYLINLANPDPEAHTRSIGSFISEMELCSELGLTMLNIHPGSHLRKCTPEEGIANIARGVNQALATVPGVTVILENTAGQGGSLGVAFEELAAMIASIDDRARVGICLDTAHLHAAGHDLVSPAAYEETMARFDKIIGLRYLRAWHLNDTKVGLGGRVDRHAPLGDGNLGWETFRNVVGDPRNDGLPLIIETPEEDRWSREIRALYELAG